MESNALITLPRLEPVPSNDVPNGRRTELATLQSKRRALKQSRDIEIILTGYFGIVTLALLFFAACAALGESVFISVGLGGLGLIVGVITRISWRSARETCQKLDKARIDPILLDSARDEATLAESLFALNTHILIWNSAAERAEGYNVSPSVLNKLRAKRHLLAGRREKIICVKERLKSGAKTTDL